MSAKNHTEWCPGQLLAEERSLEDLTGRPTATIRVRHTGDRPVQVGSHFHFFEVNKCLDFTREQAYGMRLAIPAGTAVRFEPGMEAEVDLIAYGGDRVCYGFNNLVDGPLDEAGRKQSALAAARNRGFKGA